jgi:hypothetical protein
MHSTTANPRPWQTTTKVWPERIVRPKALWIQVVLTDVGIPSAWDAIAARRAVDFVLVLEAGYRVWKRTASGWYGQGVVKGVWACKRRLERVISKRVVPWGRFGLLRRRRTALVVA